MTNKILTELVFLIDKSGSMSGLEKDTIGSFNSLIKKMRKSTNTLVSTFFFNDKLELIYDRVPIGEIQDLSDSKYFVNGSTALLDAIGKTIHHIRHIHKYSRKEDCPQHTIVCIITDGYENSSTIYTYDEITSLIQHQETNHNWEFLFYGADIIDVGFAAGSIGISCENTHTFKHDSNGIEECFDSLCHDIISILKKNSGYKY